MTDAAYFTCGARHQGSVKPNIHTQASAMPHGIAGALPPSRVPSHAQHGCQHGTHHATRPPPQHPMHMCIGRCHVMHPWPPRQDHGMCQKFPRASMISPRPTHPLTTMMRHPTGENIRGGQISEQRAIGVYMCRGTLQSVARSQQNWRTLANAYYRVARWESHTWAVP